MVTSVSPKTMEVGPTTETMLGGVLSRLSVARVALPAPALPAASVMPAMLTVIWTSSKVLAGKVAGALRSTVQVVPPSVVRRLLSVPLPVGIVRSSMVKPVTCSEKLKVMVAVSPAPNLPSGENWLVEARVGRWGSAGEVLIRLMAGRSPEAGMLMRRGAPAVRAVGGGGWGKVRGSEPKARPCASQYRVVSVVDEDGDSRRFAGFEGGVIHGDAVGHGVFLSME